MKVGSFADISSTNLDHSAWQAFLDEGRDVQANSWEELWELMPELSVPEYSASGGKKA
ncbi:MAG: hypothetical protein OEM26_16110 [Saprospiraceae bacterium]|nr:hypothetical protein [Saprospiraceae bacterium]